MEEEEKSILASVLGYAGETLDKPGRFARGVLSTALNYGTGFNYGQADPRAILNIIPFSDALGYTDPRKELNARQAYAPAAYGMNAPGSGDFLPSVGDAVLDMATDPSSYISFGFLPAAKLGMRALMEAPSMLGFGAKALNAVPDVVSAASKVAPDVITAAAKSNLLSNSKYELVKSPVEWFVSACRALELVPSKLETSERLVNYLDKLGQVPFAPPNVGGWPAEAAWLSSATSLYRIDFAKWLIKRSQLQSLNEIPVSNRVIESQNWLGVYQWSERTKSTLNSVASDPEQFALLALCSPEYVVSA